MKKYSKDKTKFIGLRIEEVQLKALETIAKKYNCSISEIIRAFLNNLINSEICLTKTEK